MFTGEVLLVKFSYIFMVWNSRISPPPGTENFHLHYQSQDGKQKILKEVTRDMIYAGFKDWYQLKQNITSLLAV